ncbi:MAG: response regulator [Fibrobacter sp.]|nr:response regulator [Fibrobacter sp.]
MAEQKTQGRVLFLDDEPYIIKMAESILKSIGYTVKGVLTGDEAVMAFREEIKSGGGFDALILDLNVKGGMGGMDVVKVLSLEFKDLNAVASSGYSNDPAMADPYSYGFKAAIKKPYTRNELKKVLESLGGN